MSSFSHAVDANLRTAADHIPNIPVYTAGITLPIWWPSLTQLSQFAGLVTPIVLFVLALIKVYGEFAAWIEARRAAGNPPGRALVRIVGAVLAALGVVALLAWVTTSSAKAAPALPAATAQQSRKRKRSDDDDEPDGGEPDLSGKSKLYDMALSFLGVEEALPNGRANPAVKEMFSAVKGFDPKTVDCRRVPWCAVFVNYCLQRLGVPGTNSAMARSFLYWGKETDDPKTGDVVVFFRGKYDDGEAGHVAVFERFEGDYVVHVGGNQSDAVTRTKTHKSRVLQFRRHMSLWQSRQMLGVAAKGAAAAGTAAVAVNEATSGPAADAAPKTNLGEHVEAVREPLSQVSEFLPGRWQTYALAACAVLGLLGVAIVWYERRRYQQAIGW